MNNMDIIVGVLYLKEASDLLKTSVPEVSYSLLELSQTLLNTAKISADELINTDNIITQISNISASTQLDGD